MFISGIGVINNLKNNHQYGQKFQFCGQFQPKLSKIDILFIGSPSIFTNNIPGIGIGTILILELIPVPILI